MATTRGWALYRNISNAIVYILDLKHSQEKTEDGVYTYTSFSTGSIFTAEYEMKEQCANKKKKEAGYHFQFSLPPGEGTPEECLRLAMEWFETISQGLVDYVLAVHTDTGKLHAHIVSSSIKRDGSNWDIYWKREKNTFRKEADRICRENGFSVLEKTEYKGRTYYEWMNDKNKTDPNREVLKKLLDYLIPKVKSYEDLKSYLSKLGFQIADDEDELDSNVFTFTANKKLIKEMPDGSKQIRIPYSKDYIEIEEDEFEWLNEGKTIKVSVPNDRLVRVYGADGLYKGQQTVEQLKEQFEDKTKHGRKGLRIKVPGGKRFIRTVFLDEKETYSKENIKKKIDENGRMENDEKIDDFINSKKSYDDVDEERRRAFQNSDVHFDYKTSTIYKSLRQERYFEWKAKEIQKVIDRNNYRKLLQKDKENLSMLKERKETLQNELRECYSEIHKFDEEVVKMMQDRMEGIVEMTDEEFTSYVKESKERLEEKKNRLKEMIRLYKKRIERVEKDNDKQKQQAQQVKEKSR